VDLETAKFFGKVGDSKNMLEWYNAKKSEYADSTIKS
jgi:hypothetical protein